MTPNDQEFREAMRLHGQIGGKARAAKLSQARRREIAVNAAAARWAKRKKGTEPVADEPLEALKGVPRVELLKEIQRRDAEARRVEEARRDTEDKAVCDAAVALLQLVPRHNRVTGCSDENPRSAYGCECLRCALVDAAEHGLWDKDFVLRITVEKRLPLDKVRATD